MSNFSKMVAGIRQMAGTPMAPQMIASARKFRAEDLGKTLSPQQLREIATALRADAIEIEKFLDVEPVGPARTLVVWTIWRMAAAAASVDPGLKIAESSLAAARD